jgi:hypothetical protein
MAYIGKSIESGTFSVLDTSGNTYNGSNTTFNLGTQVGSVAQLLVSHDGVIQKPGTDYTLASGGTQITFTTAPASGASIFIVEISGAVGGPLDADLNGTELILDADGDTSLHASTDDQIDIKIAGADDFKFSANAMNVLSGSTLTIDSGATITNSGTANGFGTDPDGAQVFNESGADVDFRVESNDNTHMFFIDGGNNRVGMVTTPDLGTGLHIRTADSGGGVEANADELVVEGSGNTGISILSGTANVGAVHFNDSGGNERGAFKYNHNADELQIQTAGSERMRIHSSGRVSIGNTTNTHGLDVVHSNGGNYMSLFTNSNASNPYGMKLSFSAAADDNTTTQFLLAADSGTTRFIVTSDGDVQNHDNSYGSISDQRIKQNITDSGSQWDDIKAVKVRKFKKKDDVRQYAENAWEQIGVVAQELEASNMDKLVRESDPSSNDILSDSSFGTLYEDGDDIPEGKKIGDVKEVKAKVKSVNYSILYMKAIKALQEAMAKIETLETKVKALEDA